MKRCALLAALLWWSVSAHAAFEYPAVSARHAALSNSYSAFPGGDAFLLNPALSAFSGGLFAALNYSQLFNLADLRYASGQIVFPLKNTGWGGGIESLGGELYSETKLTMNAARFFLGEQLSLGISAHLYHISVKNYDSISAWGVSLGFLYALSDQWRVGGALENVNRPKLNGYAEELPQTIRMGTAYQPVADVQAFLSVEKDRWHAPDVFLGVSYQLFAQLSLQSGYTSREDQPSLGLQFSARSLEIGYGLQYHFDLGETHFFSVAYRR